jgi:hypothetical protein
MLTGGKNPLAYRQFPKHVEGPGQCSKFTEKHKRKKIPSPTANSQSTWKVLTRALYIYRKAQEHVAYRQFPKHVEGPDS